MNIAMPQEQCLSISNRKKRKKSRLKIWIILVDSLIIQKKMRVKIVGNKMKHRNIILLKLLETIVLDTLTCFSFRGVFNLQDCLSRRHLQLPTQQSSKLFINEQNCDFSN